MGLVKKLLSHPLLDVDYALSVYKGLWKKRSLETNAEVHIATWSTHPSHLLSDSKAMLAPPTDFIGSCFV
jgi:hypothetical protein